MNAAHAAVVAFLGLLTWLAVLYAGGSLLSTAGARVSARLAAAHGWLARGLRPNALRLAWAVSVAATAGSLYFSNAAGFTPCSLCWYQRIAMYPLTVVLGAALLGGGRVRWYAGPLAAAGGLLSLYHLGVQRLPALDAGTCAPEAPCTLVWVQEFGFMTIPFMALAAFGAILVSLFVWDRPAPDLSS